MANISVYNTGITPVIVGDGRTIGGMEWAVVSEEEAAEHLAIGVLITGTPMQLPDPEPVVDPVIEEPVELPSIDDSNDEETAVSSEAATEVQDDEETSVDDVPSVEEPEIEPTPTTIRRSRRRK